MGNPKAPVFYRNAFLLDAFLLAVLLRIPKTQEGSSNYLKQIPNNEK